jgi:hypothetical protein
VDLVRFLTAVVGTRTAPFLSAALTDRMLSTGPGGVGIHPNGGWFGLGWDDVQRWPDGVLFEKDGGVTGSMTWIEHDPSGVDWALFLPHRVTRGRSAGPPRVRLGHARRDRRHDCVAGRGPVLAVLTRAASDHADRTGQFWPIPRSSRPVRPLHITDLPDGPGWRN